MLAYPCEVGWQEQIIQNEHKPEGTIASSKESRLLRAQPSHRAFEHLEMRVVLQESKRRDLDESVYQVATRVHMVQICTDKCGTVTSNNILAFTPIKTR